MPKEMMQQPGLLAQGMQPGEEQVAGMGPGEEEMGNDQEQSLQGNLTPEEEAQLDAYSDNASMVIYSEKSQAAILQELQATKNPVQDIANTANHIHSILSRSLEKQGENMTDKTMLLGATHLVSELIMLGESAKLFQIDNKQRMDALQATIMIYFKKGLDNGTIDPVALQKEIEPLMSEEQRKIGEENIQKTGVSRTPPPVGQKWGASAGQQAGIVGGNYGK